MTGEGNASAPKPPVWRRHTGRLARWVLARCQPGSRPAESAASGLARGGWKPDPRKERTCPVPILKSVTAWRNCCRSRSSRRRPSFAARAQVRTRPYTSRRRRTRRPGGPTQARERLHWDTPFSSVLDDSNAPFYTWFADGTINVSYNCLDRHVLAGRGDRVAFYWRGEEGEERELTYAELLDDVQRLANALKAQGVAQGRRRRHLPADDPRGRRGHARLRPHRRAAHRRLRRLRSHRGARAAGGLPGQGADRRGRGPPQGQVPSRSSSRSTR